MERNTVKILGFEVDSFSCEDAIKYIKEQKGIVITINPEMIQCAKSNSEFAELINTANLVIPDGIGVEIGLKILGHNIKRIAGIEFARKLIDEFSKDSLPIAFVGAKPEIIQKTVENLKKEVASLNVCYVQDGYFNDDERVLKELKISNPKLVLAALGSPKQEFFISELKSVLPDAVMIGLGGSFDVWAGMVKRAPKVFQKLGIEWLYRTIAQPERVKRIFPALPVFVLKVIRERMIGK